MDSHAVENVLLFARAVIAGFVVAVPVGAIGAMCLRRALQGQWLMGLVTGCGAALADCILAFVAVFGLSIITKHLLENQEPLQLVGGVFLVVIGAHMIRSRHVVPHPDSVDAVRPAVRTREVVGAFFSGFSLTIINPATFLAFVGVFAGLFADRTITMNLVTEGLLLGGVFAGSMLWWIVLTGGSAALRHHLPHRVVAGINGGLGVIVLGFGVFSLFMFAQHHF